MLTDRDLEFVVAEVAPKAKNPGYLKQLIMADDGFREGMIGDERLFQRIVDDDKILLIISPSLYFEVLLRKVLKEIHSTTHTLEQAGKQTIPVFDSGEIVELLSLPGVLMYLAQMLASFTRINSHVSYRRIGSGIRRRVRHNDMDIDSLLGQLDTTDEEQRFNIFKRVADVMLNCEF